MALVLPQLFLFADANHSYNIPSGLQLIRVNKHADYFDFKLFSHSDLYISKDMGSHPLTLHSQSDNPLSLHNEPHPTGCLRIQPAMHAALWLPLAQSQTNRRVRLGRLAIWRYWPCQRERQIQLGVQHILSP